MVFMFSQFYKNAQIKRNSVIGPNSFFDHGKISSVARFLIGEKVKSSF